MENDSTVAPDRGRSLADIGVCSCHLHATKCRICPRTLNHTTAAIHTSQEDDGRTPRYAPSNLVEAGVTASRTANRSAQNTHMEGRIAIAGGKLLRLELDGMHPHTDLPSDL